MDGAAPRLRHICGRLGCTHGGIPALGWPTCRCPGNRRLAVHHHVHMLRAGPSFSEIPKRQRKPADASCSRCRRPRLESHCGRCVRFRPNAACGIGHRCSGERAPPRAAALVERVVVRRTGLLHVELARPGTQRSPGAGLSARPPRQRHLCERRHHRRQLAVAGQPAALGEIRGERTLSGRPEGPGVRDSPAIQARQAHCGVARNHRLLGGDSTRVCSAPSASSTGRAIC